MKISQSEDSVSSIGDVSSDVDSSAGTFPINPSREVHILGDLDFPANVECIQYGGVIEYVKPKTFDEYVTTNPLLRNLHTGSSSKFVSSTEMNEFQLDLRGKKNSPVIMAKKLEGKQFFCCSGERKPWYVFPPKTLDTKKCWCVVILLSCLKEASITLAVKPETIMKPIDSHIVSKSVEVKESPSIPTSKPAKVEEIPPAAIVKPVDQIG